MAGLLTAYLVVTSVDSSVARKAVQKVADLVEHSVAQKADPSVQNWVVLTADLMVACLAAWTVAKSAAE
jgi:hypothetical protein